MNLSQKGLEFQKHLDEYRRNGYFECWDSSNPYHIVLDMAFLLEPLDLLAMEKRYSLRGAISPYNDCVELYAELDGAYRKDHVKGKYPPEITMNHFNVLSLTEHLQCKDPFSEMGILQAFLLFNAWYELPMFGHGNYNRRIYLYGENLIEKLPACMSMNVNRDAVLETWPGDYLDPKIEDSHIRVAYWSDFGGLFVSDVLASTRNVGNLFIGYDFCELSNECLVAYNSDVLL